MGNGIPDDYFTRILDLGSGLFISPLTVTYVKLGLCTSTLNIIYVVGSSGLSINNDSSW